MAPAHAQGSGPSEPRTLKDWLRRPWTAQVALLPLDERLPPMPRVDLHRERDRLVLGPAPTGQG